MHARLTTVSIQPGKTAEMPQDYQDSVVPVVAAQPGFKAVDLLSDEATSNGHSLTIWDSEADGLAYGRTDTYQAQVDKIRQYFASALSLKT
jgi:heme-degrading monooxygenase HmoA